MFGGVGIVCCGAFWSRYLVWFFKGIWILPDLFSVFAHFWASEGFGCLCDSLTLSPDSPQAPISVLWLLLAALLPRAEAFSQLLVQPSRHTPLLGQKERDGLGWEDIFNHPGF